MTEPTLRLAGILIDTTEIRGRRHRRLCREAARRGIPVYVSAITHGEILRHIRTELPKTGGQYSPVTVAQSLADLGIEVTSVDERVAATFAEAVWGLWPTDEEWQERKRARCRAMLGLGDNAGNPGARCSATSDWFIAATAAAHDWLMVTDDRGDEFAICESVTASEALQILASPADEE